MVPSENVLAIANQIPGMMWLSEMKWLMDNIEPSKIHAEIGTYCGRSLYPTACGMGSGKIFSVDNNAMILTPIEWKRTVLHATISMCPKEISIEVMCMPGIEAARVLAENKIQLDSVFIDADHREPAVTKDIQTWAAILKPGGIIAGHDYCGSFPGVIEAVNKSFSQFKVAEGTRIWHTRKESLIPSNS